MAYLHGKLEVTSEVRSVPLGQKRKRGRPKKMPHCLTRSPPVHPTHIPEEEIANTEPVIENVPDDSFIQTEDPEILVTPTGPVATRGGRGRCVQDDSNALAVTDDQITQTTPAPIAVTRRGRGRGVRRGRGRGAQIVQQADQLSEYELLREKNIKEREEVFRSLNITEHIASCKEGMSDTNLKTGKSRSRGRGLKRKIPESEVSSPRKLRSRK